jgi:hypothetical protein
MILVMVRPIRIQYLAEAVQGRRRESHSGEAKAAHGEAAAQKALGHISRVSQAVGRIQRRPSRTHEQIKRRLAAGQPTPP